MRLHVLGSDETEWIEQDEPGVHIYLTSLVGLIYLKRLCFRYRMLYYIFTFFFSRGMLGMHFPMPLFHQILYFSWN